MPYIPCENSEVGMNAVKDCINPAFEGLKMMAIGFAKSDIASVVRGATAATKNHVSAITLKEGAKTFVIEAGGEIPWADTNEEFDPATGNFNKTATFIAPAHGAGFASHFVEGLMKNKDGYVFVLQRKDTNGDCAYPIIGLEKGAVGATGTLDYNATETAGCYTLALTEPLAPSAEIDLFDEDYATTQAIFDGLVAKSF